MTRQRGTPFKLPNRLLPYSKRGILGLFLSSHDRNYMKKLRALYHQSICLLGLDVLNDEEEEIVLINALLIDQRIKRLLRADDIDIRNPPSLRRTIDSFELRQYWTFFNTTKEDLSRIFNELLFEEQYTFACGNVMSGEEVFLRGFYELRTGENQFLISELVFGGGQPLQSLAFKCFIEHIHDMFKDLVSDNLGWWYNNGWLDKSRDAISRKMEELGLRFNNIANQNVSAFIDCNCLETCKVLHGPAEPGKGARRWNPLISEAFYNGWKSNDGLKHQTLESAFGLCIDMYGPLSLRRNDMRLLAYSRILQRFAAMQVNRPAHLGRLGIKGDSAYPWMGHLSSYHKKIEGGPELTERQLLENRVLKQIRESIEWSYGLTAAMFRYLTNLLKLKLMQGTKTQKVYTVATILRNCHIILYGGITSDYFNLGREDFPTLEQYLRQI